MTGKTVRLVPMTIDEAEDARRSDDPYAFSQAMLTEDEFLGIELPPRRDIVAGLIAEESINIVNGFRGQGKSFLAMGLSVAVTRKHRIGPWEVVRAVNTLLVDGEMPTRMVQDRLRAMHDACGMKKHAELFLYPEGYAYRIGLHRANILDSTWREAVLEMIRENDIGLVILDNLSSLAPGIDENDKLEFDPVNRWLLEIRYHGAAVVMTHHTGKSGGQRGTSAHEDHVDLSLLLTRPRDYLLEMGCRFEVKPIKDRADVMHDGGATLQLMEGERGGLEFVTVQGKEATVTLLDRCVQMLVDNPDLTEKAATEKGISRRTYFRAKKATKTEQEFARWKDERKRGDGGGDEE